MKQNLPVPVIVTVIVLFVVVLGAVLWKSVSPAPTGPTAEQVKKFDRNAMMQSMSQGKAAADPHRPMEMAPQRP